MYMHVALISRTTTPIAFSNSFEGLLFTQPETTMSLVADIETAAYAGLKKLAELEDVHDLQHVDAIRALVLRVNDYAKTESNYFDSWKLDIDKNLLEEVGIIDITHGEDLVQLGLNDRSHGTLIILLALAQLLDIQIQSTGDLQ